MKYIQRISTTLIRESSHVPVQQFNSSRDIYKIMSRLENLDREEFWTLGLNTKNKIVSENLVSVGSLNMSIVHPREVFKALICSSAAAFVCVHNHPSGDPAPSPEDRAMTRKISLCGSIFGIPMLDHIIIGHQEYYSFADDGVIFAINTNNTNISRKLFFDGSNAKFEF